MQEASIADWVREAALDCLRAQQLLDGAYLRDRRSFEELMAGADGLAREILRPLAPCRQVIQTYEAGLSLLLEQTSFQQFGLTAEALNLNSMIRFRVTRESGTKIRLTVQVQPVSREENSNAATRQHVDQ
jgi:hypothetical protein